ncbi:MAG: hypothetical protein IJ446_08905 [Oscillospiraceae bacterium]|nr:hypothetical protein [Oscillospiraceae bacterium]
MTKEEYGFGLYKGGLAVYDGTMTDIMPAEDITFNDNLTEVTYRKGKYTVKLTLSWSDETLTSYRRTVTIGGNTVYEDKGSGTA